MRLTARRLVLGALVFTAAPACGDAFGIDNVLGIWNTTSINGYPLPGTVDYEGVDHEAEYARWAFYDGGLCTLTQLVNSETSTIDECEYSVDQERKTVTVVLLYEVWDGSWDRGSLVVVDPQDIIWVLDKQ